MNYWLTTHWPPREGDSPTLDSGIWVPHGRHMAGYDLQQGDLVLVYEANSGRTVIRIAADGVERKVKSLAGRGGIILIGKAKSALYHSSDVEPERYVDGSVITWSWHAPVEILSCSGFVPRVDVNRVLGYKLDYNFHGYGRFHSGLKKIDANSYEKLVELFKSFRPIILQSSKTNQKNSKKVGTSEESPEHQALKLYVAYDPAFVLGEEGLKTEHIEYPFPTGDRADIVLSDHAGRIIGVEIELNVGSNDWDGALQAIKYRYMLEPMSNRIRGDSRAMLIAHRIEPELTKKLSEYDVECYEVQKRDVEKWNQSNNL